MGPRKDRTCVQERPSSCNLEQVASSVDALFLENTQLVTSENMYISSLVPAVKFQDISILNDIKSFTGLSRSI